MKLQNLTCNKTYRLCIVSSGDEMLKRWCFDTTKCSISSIPYIRGEHSQSSSPFVSSWWISLNGIWFKKFTVKHKCLGLLQNQNFGKKKLLCISMHLPALHTWLFGDKHSCRDWFRNPKRTEIQVQSHSFFNQKTKFYHVCPCFGLNGLVPPLTGWELV